MNKDKTREHHTLQTLNKFAPFYHYYFQVKSDGKISLEIKDVGGGKLGKSEGSPLLESEAPQPILCCTIL